MKSFQQIRTESSEAKKAYKTYKSMSDKKLQVAYKMAMKGDPRANKKVEKDEMIFQIMKHEFGLSKIKGIFKEDKEPDLTEMTDIEIESYARSLSEEQLDEVIGKLVKGAGKLAFKGAKAAYKRYGTTDGKAKAAAQKVMKMKKKREALEKLQAARDQIKKEKEELRKKKESGRIPPNTIDRIRSAIKKRIAKVNDAEEKVIKATK